jgi:hypothetical protein
VQHACHACTLTTPAYAACDAHTLNSRRRRRHLGPSQNTELSADDAGEFADLWEQAEDEQEQPSWEELAAEEESEGQDRSCYPATDAQYEEEAQAASDRTHESERPLSAVVVSEGWDPVSGRR